MGTPSNILNPIQSARIRSAESFNFQYGKIEVRAQLPEGDWIWPAFWLIPRHNAYGDWPASGEIDIIETRGNKQLTTSADNPDGPSIGGAQTCSTVHKGPFYGADLFMDTHACQMSSSGVWSDAFHTWVMSWTPDGVNLTVDGQLYGQFDTPNGGWWAGEQFSSKFPGAANPWVTGGNDAPFDKVLSLFVLFVFKDSFFLFSFRRNSS